MLLHCIAKISFQWRYQVKVGQRDRVTLFDGQNCDDGVVYQVGGVRQPGKRFEAFPTEKLIDPTWNKSKKGFNYVKYLISYLHFIDRGVYEKHQIVEIDIARTSMDMLGSNGVTDASSGLQIWWGRPLQWHFFCFWHQIHIVWRIGQECWFTSVTSAASKDNPAKSQTPSKSVKSAIDVVDLFGQGSTIVNVWQIETVNDQITENECCNPNDNVQLLQKK